MLELKRIFCPVDLSPESAQALRYAVALTRAYAAELTVCHCIESNAQPALAQVAVMQATLRNELAEHVCLACPDAIAWEPLLVQGEAASEIVRAAAEHRADLIVMRSRRRPHAAALLGSTAETICRTAPCPVLITHPGEREWAGLTSNGVGLERILLAHDFSSDAEVALTFAASLAQQFQAECNAGVASNITCARASLTAKFCFTPKKKKLT
jgi:universal stress protein A